ncbi:alpha/beta hydrolase [Halobacteriales archaeon QS_1_68_20]|nr:MAG: alpha/beta hydrolase [Halobacteriales archaeon QS_1_68_20]
MTDPATESYRVRTDALTTERGEGPPLLCAHGTLMDRTMFAPQVDALSDEYRVAAYDLRGRTEHWRGPYDLWDLVEDCQAVMDGLEMDAPVLVGMSMGGYVALRVALEYPDRLSGLVLIDSTAEPHPEEEREQYAGMFAELEGADSVPREMAETVSQLFFGATAHQQRSELVERWVDRWCTYVPGSIYHTVHSFLDDPGVVDSLDEIDLPALVVHGEEDEGLPPARGRRTAEGLPDGRFESIPAAGHSSNLENPEAVNDAVRAFLAEVY